MFTWNHSNTLHLYRCDDGDDGDDFLASYENSQSETQFTHNISLNVWTDGGNTGCACFEVIFRHLSNICEKYKQIQRKKRNANRDNVRFCFSLTSIRLFNQSIQPVTWARKQMKIIRMKTSVIFLFEPKCWAVWWSNIQSTRNINELSAKLSE